jgi:predicted nucleic acid-binding Zn ribbon protein
MNDAVLTTCPECGKDTFAKQLSAAGFQLKGSGWYATDFKGGSSKPKDKPKTENAAASTESVAETKAASCASDCACH